MARPRAAGPLLGLPGTAYTVTETGSGGTNLANYTTTWECRNASAGGAVVAQGTGASGTFTMPASAGGIGAGVVCTFTNTPIPPPGDSGDAPESYGTLNASTGARHGVPNYNTVNNTAPLMLGAKIDVEDDGAPGAGANGDDSAGVDDEDGVVFNTDVSVPGRLETVFVTASAAGFLNGWIDFDRDGDFDGGVERIFSDRAVTTGVNRLTYTVPDEPDFVGGQTFARFRLSGSASQVTTPTGAAPNGEVEDYARTLFDAEGEALEQCPRGSFPRPVGIIQNPSFEDYEQEFSNGSANTINNAEHWFDAHPTGGQYYVFSPAFDSGPAESVMPFRAGADGYGFLGGHSSGPGDSGEGASNTLAEPMVPGAAYVGFFSTGAGGHSRNGSGHMRMFGTSDVNAGSINTTKLTAANSEALFDTPDVSPAAGGARPQWRLSTFRLRPTEAWQYFRVESRNQTPANNGSTPGQTWMSFDDFHLYLCDPIRDFGDAPASYGTMLGDDPAFHEVPDFDDGNNDAPLTLGDSLDVEDDGMPGTGSDGDDTDASDDEDGVAEPISVTVGEAPMVSVSVTNDTAQPATLAGWVDLNKSGTFEQTERVTRDIPAGSGTADYDVTFPTASTIAETYARFRLFPETMANPSPTGLAEAGEVEDYPVTVEPPTVTCATDAALFNTAYNGTGGKLPVGSRDRNWEVGIGNATGPASVSSYIPAFVIPPVAGAWDASPFGNADWISYNANGGHAARIDLYFRYRFRIDADVPLGGFAMQMDFMADNSVPEVWINGTAQSPTQEGLPQTPPATAYVYTGFKLANRASTVLSDGFQNGANDIVVRVSSDPGAVGFMAQMQQSPLCNDWGDAPNSYGTDAAAGGASHGVRDAAAAQLLLGDAVDVEPEGLPGTGADGDDAEDVDDEEAVDEPVSITEGSGGTVSVSATNDTNQVATLAGWIDLNGNGLFSAGERVIANVPANSGTADYDLVFAAGTTTDDTYARFRLFPGNVADPSPTGSATAGEVEDHRVSVDVPGVDFGDAPATYSTTQADNGPSHQLTGYNPVADTADVMLGASVDREADGQPNLAATGDDTADSDDEDGVDFNPSLGYPDAVIRTGMDAATGNPVLNHLDVDASADGFASVWVDWNIDGDFADDGERVVNAVPVMSGSNDVTFSRGGNPDDIRTYVRVRYSTDAASLAQPTGSAPDGEVEDYRVLVERLVVPDACTPVGDAFYAMTFNRVGAQTGTGTAGSTTRYPDVTVAHGVPVDMMMRVVEGRTILHPVNGMGRAGDDASWNIPGVTVGATLSYSFFVAGTDTPVAVNGMWTINDMDNTERAVWDPASQLAGYAITPGSEVAVDTLDTSLMFTGTRSGSGDEWTRWRVWFTGRTTLQARWTGFQNSGFGLDGDGDTPVPPSCDDYGDAPDSYGTTLLADGPRHRVTEDLTLGELVDIDGNGRPSPSASIDDNELLDDEDAVEPIEIGPGAAATVTVSAINNTAQDATLAGWLDLDADGAFEAGELVTATVPAGSGDGSYDLDFPAASFTADTFARFRLFPGIVADPSPVGAASGGEVEDHRVQLPFDFGDAPDSYGTTKASNGANARLLAGLFLGTTPDPEGDGQPSAGADADDISGTDDEDGVDAPIVAVPGEPTVVQVEVTNSRAGAAVLAGWIDLDGDGTFETAERQFVRLPVNSGVAVQTFTFPPVTTLGDTYARFRVMASNPFSPMPTGSGGTLGTGGEIEDYPVNVQNRELEITKTSDATTDTRPGDIVNYTVTMTNTGDDPFTALDPAVLVDDLTDVLDDGAYNGDATARIGVLGGIPDPTYAEPRLRWAGPLPPGATVTVTYSVTLTGGGDGVVRNVTWAPDPADPSPPTPDCDDPSTDVPCAEEEFELPRLTLRKASDRTDLPALGEHLTYTVVVKNEGPGDYTAAAPATFVDDLTEVLDDASFDVGSITSSTGTATFTDPDLSWSGVLAAGESATITYSVTYAAKAGGDQQIDNAACIPEDEAVDPNQACTTVRVPGSGLEQSKVSDPPNGTAVMVGDEITYTLRFSNTGPAPATVDTVDDLSGVLDDAELIAGPTAQAGLTTNLNGEAIEITGSVPTGESRTVTYTVRVRAIADQDDHVLRNALACQPGDPPSCEPEITEHEVRALEVTKTSDATAETRQGDSVTYTITAKNTGAGDYTAAEPAVVVDDLTGVLDDADYNDDAGADLGDDPTYTAPRVRWAGALDAGDTVTITYTVTLKAGGDGVARNVAWGPDPGDPAGPDARLRDPATTVPCAEEEFELPRLSITKTADRTELPAVGQDMTYTVVVTNEGPGDYTAGAPASFADDLSAVLDDAAYVAGSATADVGTASFSTPDALVDRRACGW